MQTHTAPSLAAERLRCARSCYDHLAGRAGVAVTEALVRARALQSDGDSFRVTRRGEALFEGLNIDLDALRSAKRPLTRACLDWSERRPHLGGALGAALLHHVLASRWFERSDRGRTLQLTPEGRVRLKRVLGIELDRSDEDVQETH